MDKIKEFLGYISCLEEFIKPDCEGDEYDEAFVWNFTETEPYFLIEYVVYEDLVEGSAVNYATGVLFMLKPGETLKISPQNF